MDLKIFQFLKSPTGIIALLIVAVVLGGFFLSGHGGKAPEGGYLKATGSAKFGSDRQTPNIPAAKRHVFSPPKKPSSPVIDVYTSHQRTAPQPGLTLPFGRTINCRLVYTVDTSSLTSPIVGIVTDDVYIPGGPNVPLIQHGTEVHGFSQGMSVRDRVGAQTTWVLVYTDGSGREMTVKALALDREESQARGMYAASEGSAGLRGYKYDRNNGQMLKMLMASLLQGMGMGMMNIMDFASPIGAGGVFGGTMKTAIAYGVASAAWQYSMWMMNNVDAQGTFVRVPSGTPFLLYTIEDVDPDNAVVGGAKLDKKEMARWEQKAESSVQRPMVGPMSPMPFGGMMGGMGYGMMPGMYGMMPGMYGGYGMGMMPGMYGGYGAGAPAPVPVAPAVPAE